MIHSLRAPPSLFRLAILSATEQALEPSRVQRDAHATIESVRPLDIDLAFGETWQFGQFTHQRSGEPVCAALSGFGEPAPTPGEPMPRLLVLADGVWVRSDASLAADWIESAVRIDSGLPVPLEFSSDGRLASLAGTQQALLERLRAGIVATLRVVAAPASTSGDSAPTEDTGVAPGYDDAALGGASTAIERVIDLDQLPTMLDELARCAELPTSARGDNR